MTQVSSVVPFHLPVMVSLGFKVEDEKKISSFFFFLSGFNQEHCTVQFLYSLHAWAEAPVVQKLRSDRTEILSTPLLWLSYMCIAQFQDFQELWGFGFFFFKATQCSCKTLILK